VVTEPRHAVRVNMRPIIEEELFNNVRHVTEAQDEVFTSILAVGLADGNDLGNHGCAYQGLRKTKPFFHGQNLTTLLKFEGAAPRQTKPCAAASFRAKA
jgi:hypothetical protein